MSHAEPHPPVRRTWSFPPPARFAAPLLVLVFGLATTWLNYRWNLANDLARGQAELRATADATGARLARLGEQLRSAVGIAALQADLRASAEAPNLALAAFVDANGWVLAGSSGELSGHEARQTLLRAAANLVGRSTTSTVLRSEDAAQLYAAYPVVNSDSWVLLVYDRSATMQQARAAAWRSLEWSAVGTGTLCAALWAVLYFGFAKRIAHLAQAVRDFGADGQTPITPMTGGDGSPSCRTPSPQWPPVSPPTTSNARKWKSKSSRPGNANAAASATSCMTASANASPPPRWPPTR